jgi:hypothetical protein
MKTYHYDASGKLTGHTESPDPPSLLGALFWFFIGIPILLPVGFWALVILVGSIGILVGSIGTLVNPSRPSVQPTSVIEVQRTPEPVSAAVAEQTAWQALSDSDKSLYASGKNKTEMFNETPTAAEQAVIDRVEAAAVQISSGS